MTHEEKVLFIKDYGVRQDYPSGGEQIPGQDHRIWGAKWDSRIIVCAQAKLLEEFRADANHTAFPSFVEMFQPVRAHEWMSCDYYGDLPPCEPQPDHGFVIYELRPELGYMILRGGFVLLRERPLPLGGKIGEFSGPDGTWTLQFQGGDLHPVAPHRG